jgi:hypothetical protein
MGFFFTGDRGSESTFLQRGVSNEPCGCRGRRTRVGPRVRIRFAPAASLLRTGWRLARNTIILMSTHLDRNRTCTIRTNKLTPTIIITIESNLPAVPGKCDVAEPGRPERREGGTP